jgi:hypothetical protein
MVTGFGKVNSVVLSSKEVDIIVKHGSQDRCCIRTAHVVPAAAIVQNCLTPAAVFPVRPYPSNG